MAYERLCKARNQSNQKVMHLQNSHQELCPKLAYITEMNMYKNRFILGLNSMTSNLCAFGSGSGTGFGGFVQLWLLKAAGKLL